MDTKALAAPRLTPFLLPPATTSRFLLLITLTLGAAAYTFTWLAGGPTGWEDRYQRCMAAADASTLPALDVTQQHLDCHVGVSLLRAGVGAGSAVAVAVVLVVLYLLHPRWLIRRQGMRPLDPAVYPVAAEEIARLVEESGLRRTPEFLVRPFRESRSGRAFGRWPRYRVRLDRGLVHNPDVTVLRAVVRHELAHLRHGDVDRTVLAIVSGWAFLAVVVAPQLVAASIYGQGLTWDLGWRLAVTSVLIFLLRASVIRAREHDADVRASVLNVAAGEEPFLAEAFEEPPSGRLNRVIRLHPPLDARAKTVADPGRLLRAGAVEALATGVTVGLVLPYATNLASLLAPGSPIHALVLPGVVLGALTVAVIGVGLWRATLRALVTRTPLPSGTGAATGLAAGILLGELVSSVFNVFSLPTVSLREPAQGVVAAVLLWLGCLLFCRWSVFVAAAWLPATRGRGFGPVLWAGQIVAALAFGAGLAAWSAGIRIVAESEYWWSLPFGTFGSAMESTILLPMLLAAVFPLLAAGRAGRRDRQVWLDSVDAVTLPRPRLRPGWALLPPLVPFAVLLIADHVVWPDGVLVPLLTEVASGQTAGGYTQTLLQTYGMIAFFAAVQFLVALVVCIAADPAHALVATALTGFLVTVVLIDVRAVRICDGCDLGTGILTAGAAHIVIGVIALAVVTVTGSVVALARSAFRRRPVVAEVLPGPLWRRRVSLAVSAVVAVAYLGPLAAFWATSTGPLQRDSTSATHEAAVNATEPGPVGSVSTQAACATARQSAVQSATVDAHVVSNAEVGRQTAATPSPALRAFGRVLLSASRNGNEHQTGMASKSITAYCNRVARQPVAPQPSAPVLAFGQTHRWSDGSSVSVGAPFRFTASGVSAAVIDVTIGNGTAADVPVESYTFTGQVNNASVPSFIVPGVLGAAAKTVPPGQSVRLFRAYPLLVSGAARLRVQVVLAGQPVIFEGDVPTTPVTAPPT
jgi:Zn-dependent protease with chaperone function